RSLLCRPSSLSACSHFLSFLFHTTPTTYIYTLSLQRRSSDLSTSTTTFLPRRWTRCAPAAWWPLSPAATQWTPRIPPCAGIWPRDRKSTRLNSSHVSISYAVFCLKKKKQKTEHMTHRRTLTFE